MPCVVTCISTSLPEDVRSKLEELDSDLDGGEITKKGYCNKMWKLLKPHLGDSITDQYQCLLSHLESTKLKEEEFYSEMMRFLDLNCRSKKKDDGIQFANKKMDDGAHSGNKKIDDGTHSSDKMDDSTHCDNKNVDDGTHSGDKMDVDPIYDDNKIDGGTLSDESVYDKSVYSLNASQHKESENGKNGSTSMVYETVAGPSKSPTSAGSAKKKLAAFKASPKTPNNNKASLKGPNNNKASPKTPNNTPTNTKGRKSGTQLTVYSMLMKNPDKRKVVPQTFDDMENGDCESHSDKKPKLENSAAQEEQQIKIPKLEDCAVLEEKPAVEFENERKVKSKKPVPGKCDICHQLLEDTDLRLYQGHPQDAVEEYVALTDPRLNLFNGTEEEVHESDQHPHNKITHFSVYDKAGHLCPFDSGLIERNVLLYFSGYMKAIYEESPDTEGGIPTKDMGPINEWWVSGFDGGERAVVGFSTAYGEYYLMEPSDSYAPIMETVREKIYMGKVVIEFLLDEINPTYEDLINKLQTTVPPRGIASLTEDGLLRHAQFVCDQVLSFDSADESQNLLITTSCMRSLVKLAGVTFGKRRAMRRQDKKDFKHGKAAQWSKATTTQLVSDVFEAFFTEQLDKNQNEQDKGPRRKRCGVCEACQYPDCGTCAACQDMLKFGGTGRSKQACAKRRCPNMAIQEADDSDPEDDDTDRVLAEGGEQLSNGSWTTAVQRNYKVKCGEVKKKVEWVGKTIHDDGRKSYYKSAIVGTEEISVGDSVMVESNNPSTPHYVGRVVYMWQDKSKDKYFHAHWFCRGSDTMLGETSDPQELFLVDECENCLLSAVSRVATVEFRATPENWAQLGEETSNKQEAVIDDAKTFFYQKRYDSFHGRFEDPFPDVLCLKQDAQHRFCMSCERISQKRKHEAPYVDDKLDIEDQKNQKHYGVVHWRGVEYRAGTCVFLAPTAFKFKHCEANSALNRKDSKKSKADEEMFPEFYRKHSDHVKGSNANTPQPFCIGYIKTIFTNSKEKLVTAGDICIKVIKLYRPENTHKPASLSQQVDLNILYWSDEEVIVNFSDVMGRCYIVFSENLTESINEWSNAGPNRFYFSQAYNAAKKEFTDPPKDATMIGTLGKGKGKGKGKSSAKVEPKSKAETPETWRPVSKRLRSLDVFAGCGGLSEGLHQSGIAESHWAIEKEEPAAHAFRLNNPECTVFTEDCNHLLKQVMNGLRTNDKGQVLPRKGEVELLCGGPPCQGFSGMNRFNSRQYSLFKNSLIVSYLSYCDYFRPRFFILENVRNFVSFKRSMVLKLTVRCLVKMGYQVTFGVLQAGNYGVPQTRRRAIIIAAAPGEVLPSYPEPKHVFNPRATHLTVMVDDKKFASNCKWVESAPYRTITVRDAMCDLPEIRNGANSEEMSYGGDPLSHFQRTMRGLQYQPLLRDHICKEMAPMVEARIAQIPTSMGSDWRDLPNLVVRLSDGTFSKKLLYTHHDKKNGKSSTGALRGVCSCATGKPCDPMDRQYNTLIPWCLPHTGNRHNHWAGLYGRLEWDGFFSTTVTNPEPMGKQGRVLHPEQTRVVSVRECARSQGFPDTYRFFGSILDKHRQIGNAVPPPMGAAIGWEIRKCVNK